MAWGDLAKVGKLLASLGELSGPNGAWSKKGAGSKGAGKSNDKDQGKGKTATKPCHWGDCKAAKGEKATWGGCPNCFCCNRPFSKAPPVEKMVDWAYQDLLKKRASEGNKGKGAAKGTGGQGGSAATGKGGKGGKGAAAEPPEDEEQLALLRTQRQAELKAAKDGTPEKETAIQEVARVFNEPADKGPVAITLEKELVSEAAKLAEQAKAVIDSIHGEHSPSKKTLLSPEDTLTKLLQSVATCASVETKEAAERALKATAQAVTALRASGTSDEDPDVAQLLKRQERQQKEVTRLTDKAPTVNLRKAALIEAKGAYQKQVQAEQDFTERGRLKAVARAQERLDLLQKMGSVLGQLQSAAEEC